MRNAIGTGRWSSAWPWGVAALVWGAAAYGLVFWVLQWPWGPAPAPVPSALQVQATPPPAGVQKLLGATAAPQTAEPATPVAQLLGVLGGPAGQARALLAVEGQPARPYAPGQHLPNGWQVQTVEPRRVLLQSQAGTQQWLQLPPLLSLP